jgi:HAD superfamily hydrolase (TIGR01509 family)
VKAVVFDLDGTIAAFVIDYKACRTEVKTFLTKTGLAPSLLSTKESIFEMLKKTEIFMRNNGKSKKAIEETRAKALQIAESYEFEAAKNTSLLPGVVDTLRILKSDGFKLGLFTINGAKSANFVLERFGIAGFFDAVIPREKAKQVKPSGEHLETVLEALNVEHDEAIVVGDGIIDMKSAQELKVIAVGLLTGIATKEKLVNSGANYIVSSITELPRVINKINEIVEKQQE